MGVAQVFSGGDVEHKALDSSSSVTASVNFNGDIIFGHANGDLTSLEEKLVNGQGKSVNSILHDGNQLITIDDKNITQLGTDCLLYTSPSPRDATLSRMPSSA